VAETGFHFAQPWWLLALLVILPVAIWLTFSVQRSHKGPIHLYADEHLLPHLSGTRELESGERWGRFGRWALLWALAVLAMAGPRWDYTDVRLFHPGNNLLILLDMSRSMQASDVSPTRLGRAKQEIQDLITLNRTVRIGLIAFASVPHVVAPITEDMDTVRNTLPAIETDLVRLQGSRLMAALERAEILMDGLPEESAKTILLISDGDFDEQGLVDKVRELAVKQGRLLTLGIGTEEGASVPDARGNPLTDMRGKPVVSRLNTLMLERLAQAGNGFFQKASFREGDSEAILEAASLLKPTEDDIDESTRVWNERFFLVLLVLAALLLSAFRTPARLRAET
jgi:Ca-activated chloride channel family protein